MSMCMYAYVRAGVYVYICIVMYIVEREAKKFHTYFLMFMTIFLPR